MLCKRSLCEVCQPPKLYVMSQLSPLKMYVFVGTAPLNDGTVG